MWPPQDHENGLPVIGVINECRYGNNTKWANVTWNNGDTYQYGYRIEAEGSYDLNYAGNT